MSRACQSYAGNGTHVLHIDYAISAHSEVSVDRRRQRISNYSSTFTFMIYLAIFYFSSNIGIVLADLYTEKHMHGNYSTVFVLDIILMLLLAFPITVWGILTQD